MEEKIPFPRLQNYLRNVFHVTPDSSLMIAITHSLSKWIFDLFRNAMIAGLLKYLSSRAPTSWLLWGASEIASAALLFYCLSYVHGWMLRPFHLMKNQKVASFLDLAVTLAITLPLWLAIIRAVPAAVEAIAQGQTK